MLDVGAPLPSIPAMIPVTALQRGSSGRKEGQREGEEKQSPMSPAPPITHSAPFTQRSPALNVAHASPSYHPHPHHAVHPPPPRDDRSGHFPHLTNHSPHAHSHSQPSHPHPPPTHSSVSHLHSSVAAIDSSLDGKSTVRAAVEESPDAKWARYPIKLGAGTFKDVWLAIDTETGKEVAWNVVDFRRVASKDQQRIRQETSLLTQLRHPHIIEIYDVWENPAQHTLCFITQKSSYTLKQHIANLHPAKVKVIKKYCRQILSALAYLHSLTPPIIHRDIKADNIFIDGTTGDIRIGDFGLSISSSNPTSIVGTPGFLSPEMFGESYNELVDIWSFGMWSTHTHTHTTQLFRLSLLPTPSTDLVVLLYLCA
jgi:WNK lysine deficient protein kinase